MGRINYKHSDETKKKMSENHRCKKGMDVWNKGLKGEEFKKHYKNGMGGLIKKGERRSIQTQFEKKKASWNKGLKTYYSNRKGKTMEEIFGKEKAREMKVKMSFSRKGRKAYNKGIPLSKEQKMKLSNSLKGRKVWNTGMKFPKEEYPELGLRRTRKNIIIPLRDTRIEVKIQNFLKQLNIDFFTHQYIKEIEHGYQCDILVPSMSLIIECDGDYWHKYPIGNELDHIRTKELMEKGFKVLRLWENEIKVMNVNKFKERLNE
jgi:very-short-patch-repair endonuclease